MNTLTFKPAHLEWNILHLRLRIFLNVLVLVAQLGLTLCNPMDCSLPGSYVHGILQARILEWVAVPFSRGSFQPRDQTQVSHIADSLLSEPPGKPNSSICYDKNKFILEKNTTFLAWQG